MENNTKRIGNSVELNCIAYLFDCGCEILLPYGDNQKYDIVIDYKGKLYKIQCKHANPSYKEDGTLDYITFKTSWESGRKAKKRVHYSKEAIDFFATFVENECYLVPVEHTASTLKTLRFQKPSNGQNIGVSFAKDYLGKVILEQL
jgi:hypothetical protein